MIMKPHDFFEIFVQGDYNEYLSNIGSIRHAFNAANSTSHMADQYLAYYKKYDPYKVVSFNKIGDFVEYLSKKTNDCFRDLRSISNAYKHLYPSEIVWTVTSPGALESIFFLKSNLKIKGITEEYIEETRNIDSKVVYTLKNGQKKDFLPTLETVYKFWEHMLY